MGWMIVDMDSIENIFNCSQNGHSRLCKHFIWNMRWSLNQAWEFLGNFLISGNTVSHSVDFQDVLRYFHQFLHLFRKHLKDSWSVKVVRIEKNICFYLCGQIVHKKNPMNIPVSFPWYLPTIHVMECGWAPKALL